MLTLNISRSFPSKVKLSEKNSAVMRMFGLSTDRLKENIITHQLSLEINPGDIIFITGPSGAGKSVLLREIEKAIDPQKRINLNDIELPNDKTLIECIEGNLNDALKSLSIAGLNDVFCMLNTPANLSEGQKYRFRFAQAIASKKEFVFADEFCSNLDRITAGAIAYNIAKNSHRQGPTFILASCHDDFLIDLQPDAIVIKEFTGKAKVVYKKIKH